MKRAIIAGDGIGPEVVGEAVKVLDAPRRILLDLLKVFGGIVGAGRQGN